MFAQITEKQRRICCGFVVRYVWFCCDLEEGNGRLIFCCSVKSFGIASALALVSSYEEDCVGIGKYRFTYFSTFTKDYYYTDYLLV